MPKGFVVWFTGLSGSGKSTLAAMLSAELTARGVHVEVLDGDEVRTNLSKGLSFSKEDRDTNVRRIGYVAKLVARSGACAMTAAISPYRNVREEQRAATKNFVEIYCRCDVPTLTDRDAKGLYKKALAGEIKGFTGIDDPYEAPENPEIMCDTAKESKEESLAKVLAWLESNGYVHARGGDAGRPSQHHESGTDAPALITPHGGDLIDRFVRGAAKDELAEKAKGMPTVALDERAESDIEMIAVGAFSPLRGFMNQKDYLRVVREMRLERGLPWSIPITLAVSEERAKSLKIGAQIALKAPDGRVVAVLDLTDVFTPDKELEAREVYRTTEAAHPGVAYLKSTGAVYIGGEIHVLERASSGAALFPAHRRDPAQTRAFFTEKKWGRIVAFQTRNPIHRAHEYITKCALEICDGLMIHPLVGATKSDDIPADVRMRCYETLIENYYPKGRVLLSIYPAAMRYAGPREAIFHALTRKNYGCSHFIVGRNHAGVGAYYGNYDAQELFSRFAPGELGVEPLNFETAFYSKTLDAMGTGKTAPGGPETQVNFSGTKVREMLQGGEVPPPEFTRPEVAKILVESMKRGG